MSVKKTTASTEARPSLFGTEEKPQMTVKELCDALQKLVKGPTVADKWVVGELVDFSIRGGHCYADLVEKDAEGKAVAKIPLRVWSYKFVSLNSRFKAVTNQDLGAGQNVRVRVTPSMHKLYGLSVIADEIDPSYTMGDALRRRHEIIDRLVREGIAERMYDAEQGGEVLVTPNKKLVWPDIPTRIAIISSRQAAGFGDFVNQLLTTEAKIRFNPDIFEAIMQGERACSSILAALEQIAAEKEKWDAVVIIRGGGASLDLQCFDDYNLAAAIAKFPLPVIVGIGHERDETVLDYVANRRVKTPTAAAEFFIKRAESLINRLNSIGSALLQRATDIMASEKEQLSYFEGVISVYPLNAVRHAENRISNNISALSTITARRIIPAIEKLNAMQTQIAQAASGVVASYRDRLNANERLLQALSPQAVLARGYSVTRCNGKILTDADDIAPGARLTTQLASGEIISTVE